MSDLSPASQGATSTSRQSGASTSLVELSHPVQIHGGGTGETVTVSCDTCGFRRQANTEYLRSILAEHERQADA